MQQDDIDVSKYFDACAMPDWEVDSTTHTGDEMAMAEAAALQDEARQLEIADRHIDDLTTDPGKPKPGRGPDFDVAIDAEWTFNADKQENHILSTQLCGVGEGGECSLIYYTKGPDKASRPRFSRLLLELIEKAFDEGVLMEWPERIRVSGFFLRSDLGAFSDFNTFKHKIDNVGGSAATTGDDADIELEINPDLLTDINPKGNFLAMDSGVTRVVMVRFIDLNKHVKIGTKLEEMGLQIGMPKVPLAPGQIERMDLLLAEDPTTFEAYALEDARIAVHFLRRLEGFVQAEMGIKRLKATASGVGVSLFKKSLQSEGRKIDFDLAFGLAEKETAIWDEDRGEVRTIFQTLPGEMYSIIEPFIIRCYHGGKNEGYVAGPTEDGDYGDWDIPGAYTTGLVDLRIPDYDRFEVVTDPERYRGHVLGFAYVQFEHLPDTRFPTLPVEAGTRGLLSPMRGFSYCTAPEIEVALNAGCKVNILYGVIIPWRDGDARVFEGFTEEIRRLRLKYSDDTLEGQYAKLVGNSTYGKCAQGLKPKNVFESRTMKSIQLPRSPITNAVFAAHVTGLIRAVLTEILLGIPDHRVVVSATTDGFLSDAPLAEMKLNGPLCERFRALGVRVGQGSEILKLKHRARQIVSLKTRGQLTGLPYENAPIVLAKAGVSPPAGVKDQNQYMIDLYLDRTPSSKTTIRPFVSLRKQWQCGADVYRLTRSVRLNLEFDMKRKPVSALERPLSGRMHLAFDTEPWPTIEDAIRARAIFDQWRRDNCLKTLADWSSWQARYQFSLARDRLRINKQSSLGIHFTKEGAVGLLRRVFLRAYMQGAWGLTPTKGASELAAWLTGKGYKTTRDQVNYAKKSKLVAKVIPRTPEVETLLTQLMDEYPSIEVKQFMID